MLKKALFLLFCFTSLQGNEHPYRFEGSFEYWNQKPFELAALFLPENPIILEAGAYWGDETVDMALIRPKAKIFSFEPNPKAFAIAEARLSFFESAKLFPLALSHTEGRSEFYLCRGENGTDPAYEFLSSLLKPLPSGRAFCQGPVIQVDCVRLEEWCARQGIERADFLRLDVQGAELHVLKSCPNLLQSLKGILVQTNFQRLRLGSAKFPEVRDFLERNGFFLLSHWYREGADGMALFVSDELVLGGIPKEPFPIEHYDIAYVEPPLDARFYVDDVPDSIKKHLREGRYFEGTIGRLIDKYAKTGTVAVDIGAHIGIHTIAMSRKVGPNGAVIAFEPQKKIYQEHLRNLELNGCSNVLSIRKALGEASKKIELGERNPENEGGTSIGSGGDEVEMAALDSYHLENVSLIKLDVECYEHFVLEGARDTIARNRPVILFEVMGPYDHRDCPPEIREQIVRTLAIVASMGYEITPLFSSNDFVAIPISGANE